MDQIMTGNATPAQIASLLTAMRMRGETVDEIAGFASTMRAHARHVELSPGTAAIDTCGTGGDHSGTFNISTTAAFVIAGSGIKVAKHGNRSVTSACGSADLLEALGVAIELEPDHVAQVVDEAGIAFMFAPAYHPGFRHAGPVRREIGIRTVFNILGPMTNPAKVKRQLIGVGDGSVSARLAAAQDRLGSERVLFVHSSEGFDEFGLGGPSTVTEYDRERGVRTYRSRRNRLRAWPGAGCRRLWAATRAATSRSLGRCWPAILGLIAISCCSMPERASTRLGRRIRSRRESRSRGSRSIPGAAALVVERLVAASNRPAPQKAPRNGSTTATGTVETGTILDRIIDHRRRYRPRKSGAIPIEALERLAEPKPRPHQPANRR